MVSTRIDCLFQSEFRQIIENFLDCKTHHTNWLHFKQFKDTSAKYLILIMNLGINYLFSVRFTHILQGFFEKWAI